MTTRNKILSGIVLTTLLTTGAYANCGMNDRNGNMQNQNCSMGMKKDGRNFSHHKDGRDKMSVFKMFRQLNLSDDQKTKIYEIMLESRKNIKTIDEAFTSTNFDKDKYMKIMSEKRDNMLKSKAEMIDKAYSLLTAKQKEQLKVLMDLKKERMANMPKMMNK